MRGVCAAHESPELRSVRPNRPQALPVAEDEPASVRSPCRIGGVRREQFGRRSCREVQGVQRKASVVGDERDCRPARGCHRREKLVARDLGCPGDDRPSTSVRVRDRNRLRTLAEARREVGEVGEAPTGRPGRIRRFGDPGQPGPIAAHDADAALFVDAARECDVRAVARPCRALRLVWRSEQLPLVPPGRGDDPEADPVTFEGERATVAGEGGPIVLHLVRRQAAPARTVQADHVDAGVPGALARCGVEGERKGKERQEGERKQQASGQGASTLLASC